MKEQIQDYYERTFPEKQAVCVSGLQRITLGWETEIFSFDIDYSLAHQDVRESIIMRMYPSDDAYEKSAKEFSVMRQLHDVGYPVPEVYHLESQNLPWGKPFMLMERIEGDIMWPHLINATPDKQQVLLDQFCEFQVRLHQLDWHTFYGKMIRVDVTDRYQFVDRMLDQGARYLAQFNLTGFMPVMDWLVEGRDGVPCVQPAPIHFDFHPANIMLRSDGTAVVLDWSSFEISDARFDLAWTLLLVSAYEGTIWRERILGAYENLVGAAVQQIEFFEVFACLRRLFSIVASIQGGAEKMGMDSNAVAKMQEQMFAHRRVYDRLLEITSIRVPEVEDMFNV